MCGLFWFVYVGVECKLGRTPLTGLTNCSILWRLDRHIYEPCTPCRSLYRGERLVNILDRYGYR